MRPKHTGGDLLDRHVDLAIRAAGAAGCYVGVLAAIRVTQIAGREPGLRLLAVQGALVLFGLFMVGAGAAFLVLGSAARFPAANTRGNPARELPCRCADASRPHGTPIGNRRRRADRRGERVMATMALGLGALMGFALNELVATTGVTIG